MIDKKRSGIVIMVDRSEDKQDLFGLGKFLFEQNIPSLSHEVNEFLIGVSAQLGQIKMRDIPEEIELELFAYIKAVDIITKTNTCHQMVIKKLSLGE